MDNVKIHADERWMGEDSPTGENLWAIDLGNDIHMINNTPFFTQGLSLHDTVRVDDDGEIIEVVEFSGLKNLRILIYPADDSGEALKSLAEQMKLLGASCEGGFGALLAVSITPNLVDYATNLVDGLGYAWENGN